MDKLVQTATNNAEARNNSANTNKTNLPLKRGVLSVDVILGKWLVKMRPDG